MDEFGVLTERYGLKPQGKSIPMSQAKRSTATTDRRFGSDSSLNRNPTSFSSRNSSPGNSSFGLGDDFAYDFGGFGNPNTNTSNNSSGNGSSVDLASMLFNSGPKSSSYVVDDLFGGMPVSQNAKNNNDAYHFGSFVSSTKQKAASSGDLLGDFSGVATKLKSSNRNASWDSASAFDDLIPGFGGTSPPVNRTSVKTTKSTLGSSEEPFFVFESDSGSEFSFSEAPTADPLEEYSVLNHSGGTKPRGSSNASQPLRPPKPAEVLMTDKVKSSGASPIDELEEFAMGREHNKSNRSKEAEDAKKTTRQNREDDLESFFAVHSRSTSAPKSRATTLDPMFEQNTHNRQQKTSAGASSTAKKASPVPMTAGMDDLSFIFGAASVFGEFEEVAGESEERRRARLERHQRTQDRMARAVADMNQRDRRSENEQEERRRIAEAMDFEIKRWAAGKEGNMRALLSSLQQVLWSECGWEPVSLTDLITSGSVKKVYRKATLCVHPDKVQQKGATLEQKYIAEKVFDILKEAWNKFNKEELS